MSTETETRAREMGWVPKEDFRGDPEKFVDAETFVKRGEDFLPILRANNRKQDQKIQELQAQLSKTTSLLAEATEAIAAVRESTSKAELDRLRGAKKDLKAAIKEARENEDLDTELDLQTQLRQVDDTLEEAGKSKDKKDEKPTAKPNGGDNQDPMADPAFKAWVDDNDWFNTDMRKTSLAVSIAQELRAKGDKTLGRKFFDRVVDELNDYLGQKENPNRGGKSKVEENGRSGGGGGGRAPGKTYADLPPEAKKACENVASKVVGPNKIFKTIEDWRAKYTKDYFEE